MTEEERIQIGYYIRQKRDLKGWKAAQLAEAVDVSEQTISSWENGKSDISIKNLRKLAKALDVTPMDIMAGKDITEMSMEEKEAIAKRFMELEDTSFNADKKAKLDAAIEALEKAELKEMSNINKTTATYADIQKAAELGATTITLGSKVKKISAKAFAGTGNSKGVYQYELKRFI